MSREEVFPETVEVKTVAVEGPAPVDTEARTVKSEDYAGKVTGTGVKGSMVDPKKIPLSLIDPTFVEGIGRVLRFGARKYKPGNWLNGMKWSEVISGMKRHITAIEKGEDSDPETGELHAYHLGCGVMFLSRYMSDERYAELDDRMFKAAP